MKKFTLASLMVASIGFATPVIAKNPEVTLRFSHLFPATATLNTELVEAWAEQVRKDSNGRIDVDIFPSNTLSKAPAQYFAAAHQIADISFSIQGYTSNKFPLTQIVELPGVVKDAQHGSCIVQSLYDEGLIDQEYTDTKPLFLFTHGQGHIHTTDRSVRTPEDLRGLRIRQPTAVVGKLLSDLGAQPIGMPAPEAYQSLQRGVIDGVAITWDGAEVFRLNELAKNHTEVGGLYSLAFVVTMNKNSYNSLPADLKKVIDDNSGMDWSQRGKRQ